MATTPTARMAWTKAAITAIAVVLAAASLAVLSATPPVGGSAPVHGAAGALEQNPLAR